MIDWVPRIVELVRLKEQIARHDVDRIFPYTLPSVAAPQQLLEAYEQGIGLRLDSEHRSFLAAADGWRAFFETQDLLSVEQLASGEHRDVFTAWIDSAPLQARGQGHSSTTLLPIAVDFEMPFYAAMPIVDGQVASHVLSLDPSGIIETFESFEVYFDAIIAYTHRKLTKFEAGAFGV